MKTYEELISYPTFLERFKYLKLGGLVGQATFGFSRYLNQTFYRSAEWNQIRRSAIIRDFGCDLAVDDGDHEIYGSIYIHHIEPLTIDDIKNHSSKLTSLNNLICVSFNTHNAIHYGDESLLFLGLTERKAGDTNPWKTT